MVEINSDFYSIFIFMLTTIIRAQLEQICESKELLCELNLGKFDITYKNNLKLKIHDKTNSEAPYREKNTKVIEKYNNVPLV